jgi:hypothetical protein
VKLAFHRCQDPARVTPGHETICHPGLAEPNDKKLGSVHFEMAKILPEPRLRPMKDNSHHHDSKEQ